VNTLFPLVVERVTGEQGVTFASVVEHTRHTQGPEITPLKLMQRADKAERYCEWNKWKGRVLAAYLELRG
jgi:hypothetical protein